MRRTTKGLPQGWPMELQSSVVLLSPYVEPDGIVFGF